MSIVCCKIYENQIEFATDTHLKEVCDALINTVASITEMIYC